MRKTKVFYLVVVLALSTLLLPTVHAQNVSEEARRHMARGEAAAEMAKSPAEYDSAIKEFQEAARLAPDWPDPYYNLGLALENNGRLKEAAASYKKYLQLAPNAPDAAKIRVHIYKLEYKAEQVLPIPEIIDVLVSLTDEQTWQISGDCSKETMDFRRLSFKREGNDAVKMLKAELVYPSRTYQTLKVTGPVLKYITTRNVCSTAAVNERMGGCDAVIEHEVEIVSKRLVKANQKVLRGGVGNGISDGQIFACTFQKK
jgi:Tfp pilus assembly protein PilF